MDSEIAPPLQVAWSYPRIVTFRLARVLDRVVGLLSPSGLVGLTLDGKERWAAEDATSQLVVQEHEAFTTGNGYLFRVNIENGKAISQPFRGTLLQLDLDEQRLVVKRYRSDRTVGRYRSSVSCHLAANVDGEPLWEHYDEGSLTQSTPFSMEFAVTTNRLIVGKGSARLLSIDTESGIVKWNIDLNATKREIGVGVPADLRSAPLVAGHIVLAPTPFGFGALELETGELLWRHGVHAGPFNVYEDRLYMATGINFTGYRIVDMNTGETLFERDVSDEIAKKYRFGHVKLNSGFALTETHTFVGDNFGRLWALVRDTGEPVWYHHPDNATPYVALRQPVMEDNRLYINGFSTDPNRPQHLHCYEQA